MLITLNLTAVYHTASDSHSLAVEVDRVSWVGDERNAVKLTSKRTEILCDDHLDPSAQLRGLLEEALSRYRCAARAANPF